MHYLPDAQSMSNSTSVSKFQKLRNKKSFLYFILTSCSPGFWIPSNPLPHQILLMTLRATSDGVKEQVSHHSHHLIDSLLHARHCAKHFTSIVSFNALNSPKRQVSLLTPFYKWEIPNSERWCNLPKVANDRARFQAQVCLVPKPGLLVITMLFFQWFFNGGWSDYSSSHG